MRRRRMLLCLFVVGFGLGLLIGWPTPGMLPPCPTEDSTGCYWDASEHGNGQGSDLVNP